MTYMPTKSTKMAKKTTMPKSNIITCIGHCMDGMIDCACSYFVEIQNTTWLYLHDLDLALTFTGVFRAP
jgi:hypothetical protein